MGRYAIECRVCDKQVLLVKVGDDFQCPTCKTMYESENGVWDLDEAEDMYRLYKGAKLAGLIKDEETIEEFWHG